MSRRLWNVQCTAHRRNGDPCDAWAIRGGFVCWWHGGASPRTREMARYRLERARDLKISDPFELKRLLEAR